MTTIHRIVAAEAGLREGLSRLLVDCVDGGASVGFLAPLSTAAAARYWDGVLAALGPEHALWVARDGDGIIGSVQLALCPKENGLHRAEVQKLFVMRSHRRSGVAAQLMAELETFARAAGRTLLVLDTEADSGAEAFYRRLSWRRVGEIPGYARNPDGTLRATALYFKAP